MIRRFACGLSSVMHPRNPMAPTMHFNYRYFETEGEPAWWFGGGTDITPSYLFEEDMRTSTARSSRCATSTTSAFYAKFKKWADEYFFIKHGVGVAWHRWHVFDDRNDRDAETIFAFSKAMRRRRARPGARLPLVKKHKDDDFTQKQKEWQQMRRRAATSGNLPRWPRRRACPGPAPRAPGARALRSATGPRRAARRG